MEMFSWNLFAYYTTMTPSALLFLFYLNQLFGLLQFIFFSYLSYIFLPLLSSLIFIKYFLQMYSTVCRVATVLQTRYTAPGFWHAGLNLFIGTEKLLAKPSEKEHLKTCILRAREHLDEKEKEEAMPSNRVPGIELRLKFLVKFHNTSMLRTLA
jgi:hypothetical protein